MSSEAKHTPGTWRDYISEPPPRYERVEFRRLVFRGDPVRTWIGIPATFHPEFNVSDLQWRPLSEGAR